MPYGLSFQPPSNSQQNTDGEASNKSPLQSAVRMLSLRLPTVQGASALAPQALMGAAGGSALGQNPNASSALELLKRLLSQLSGPVDDMGSGMSSGMSQQSSVPTPRIVPGSEDRGGSVGPPVFGEVPSGPVDTSKLSIPEPGGQPRTMTNDGRIRNPSLLDKYGLS